MAINWDGDEQIIANMQRYSGLVVNTTEQFAQSWAPRLETDAKENAPWKDRTGNARQSLYARVEREGDQVYLYLSHGVDYGIYLEVSKAGRNAIIWPTISRNLSELTAEFRRIFS